MLGLYGGYRYAQHHYQKGVNETTLKYETILIKERERQVEDEKIRLAVESKLREEIDTLKDDLIVKQSQFQSEYERGKQDAEAKANAVIDDMRTRNRSLSIEVRELNTSLKTSRDKAAAATATAAAATRRAALSERSAGFLIQQATKADNTLRELNLCKQTLYETRHIVQQYNQALQQSSKKKSR